MEVIRTVHEMKQCITAFHKEKKRIGFVPTMGALHKGHLALIVRALQENDKVVCSIFVNPLQFNNSGDLSKYPRNLDRDLAMLKTIGCDTVFTPEVDDIYPEPETKVYEFGLLDKVMEGRFRPGHFNGVAIVVKKLFDIITPHQAYFGEKDFQQLAIIKALVKLENLKIDIVSCPTFREKDGLAMSSRNMRLSKEQRAKAPMIYRILSHVRERYPVESPEEVKKWVYQEFEKEKPAINLEYFEIVDSESLQPLDKPKPTGGVTACIAVCFGEIRLIDNMVLNA